MGRPLFFCHIPKTAGTSLRVALESAIPDRIVRCYPPYPQNNPRNVIWPLPQDSVVCGHFLYGIHTFFDVQPRYITILRDPVERVLSWYRFKRQTPSLDNNGEAAGSSLAELIGTGHVELNNHMTTMLAGQRPSSPDDRHTLQRAKDNLSRFAWVTTENRLLEDTPRLGRILGADLPAVPFANRSAPLDLSDEDRCAAEAANKLDAELYAFAEDKAISAASSLREIVCFARRLVVRKSA